MGFESKVLTACCKFYAVYFQIEFWSRTIYNLAIVIFRHQNYLNMTALLHDLYGADYFYKLTFTLNLKFNK